MRDLLKSGYYWVIIGEEPKEPEPAWWVEGDGWYLCGQEEPWDDDLRVLGKVDPVPIPVK